MRKWPIAIEYVARAHSLKPSEPTAVTPAASQSGPGGLRGGPAVGPVAWIREAVGVLCAAQQRPSWCGGKRGREAWEGGRPGAGWGLRGTRRSFPPAQRRDRAPPGLCPEHAVWRRAPGPGILRRGSRPLPSPFQTLRPQAGLGVLESLLFVSAML